MIFAQLFYTFFIIGLFTFGGGYAMISLIQAQVVGEYGWISETQFTDIAAISQMTPGPIGINCATYVGYEVAGVAGSMVATLAIVLPSFLIILALAKCYTSVKSSPIFIGVMKGIKPAVVGLIGAAALVLAVNVSWEGMVPQIRLIESTLPDWRAWLILALSFAGTMWAKISPIWMLIAAGVVGIVLF